MMEEIKTVMIYDQGQFIPLYLILDGDYSRFDGVCINTGEDPDLEEQLVYLLYQGGDKLAVASMQVFPVQLVKDTPNIHVIYMGFLP